MEGLVSEPRRFARFRSQPLSGRPGTFPLPGDGLCLSSFLLVHPAGKPREVLVGRMDPKGPWSETAAVDPERIATFEGRWVLPACQLLFFEDPAVAARRIASEQLGLTHLGIAPPQAFSEAYGRGAGAAGDPHWDLHFVSRAEWPGGDPAGSRGHLWQELRFVDVPTTPRASFARGHGDVLALAGLTPLDESGR
jgi:hypothetical protein